MSQQQFDKLIKEKLAQQNFVPSQEGWDAIQKRVVAINHITAVNNTVGHEVAIAKSKRYFSIRKVAAVLLPILAIGGAYLMVSNHKAATNNNATATNIITKNNTVANGALENNISESENNTAQPISSKQQGQNSTAMKNTVDAQKTIAYDNGAQLFNPSTIKNKTIKNIDKILPNYNNVTSSNIIKKEEAIAVKTENKISNIIEEKIIEKEAITNEIIAQDNSIKKSQDLPQNNKQYLPLELPNVNTKKTVNRNMSFSMISGAVVNSKTTSSNAFNIGISAEKSITNRLYVDAAVSVSRNNPSWLQNQLASASSGDNLSRTNGYTIANNTALDESTSYVNAYGVNPATNSFRAGGNNISVADLADEQSIADAAAYRLASTQVELAPMVGYRIVNKLNIAAGADVAHIFQSTPYTDGAKRLLLQSQQNPTLKAWDMGLIGKVEYKVSKRIVVGYRRREGLTNMTTGANANTKRSYNGILVRLKIK